MSFLEIFQPGLKHLREERDRQKMLWSARHTVPALLWVSIWTRARPPSRRTASARVQRALRPTTPDLREPQRQPSSAGEGTGYAPRPETRTVTTKSTASPTLLQPSTRAPFCRAVRPACAQGSRPRETPLPHSTH